MTPDRDKWSALEAGNAGDGGGDQVAAVVQGGAGEWFEGHLDPSIGPGGDLRVFVRVEEGRWTGLLVTGSTADPVTVAGMRDARLGDLVELLTVGALRPAAPAVTVPPEEAEALAYRPGNRTRLTDYHLRQVAGLYNVALRVAADRPQVWMSEWWNTTPARVSRWIAAARERGLIEEGNG